MELLLIISTIVAKYEIEPQDPDAPVSHLLLTLVDTRLQPADRVRLFLQLETAEGFLRKPLAYNVKIKKRA